MLVSRCVEEPIGHNRETSLTYKDLCKPVAATRKKIEHQLFIILNPCGRICCWVLVQLCQLGGFGWLIHLCNWNFGVVILWTKGMACSDGGTGYFQWHQSSPSYILSDEVLVGGTYLVILISSQQFVRWVPLLVLLVDATWRFTTTTHQVHIDRSQPFPKFLKFNRHCYSDLLDDEAKFFWTIEKRANAGRKAMFLHRKHAENTSRWRRWSFGH